MYQGYGPLWVVSIAGSSDKMRSEREERTMTGLNDWPLWKRVVFANATWPPLEPTTGE
jgi:hypothetical protein